MVEIIILDSASSVELMNVIEMTRNLESAPQMSSSCHEVLSILWSVSTEKLPLRYKKYKI